MAMNIKDYLLGVNPMATDGIVDNVLVKRNIDAEISASEVDEKDRDLSEADVLMGIAMMPSTVGGEEEAVGNWRKKVSGSTLTAADKRTLRARAKWLYEKWEEEFPYPSASGVCIVTFGTAL